MGWVIGNSASAVVISVSTQGLEWPISGRVDTYTDMHVTKTNTNGIHKIWRQWNRRKR